MNRFSTTGEAVLVTKTFEDALRGVPLLATVLLASPPQPLVERIGETTGRSALFGEYWCGRCQVRCRFERGHSAVDLMRFGVGCEASTARRGWAGALGGEARRGRGAPVGAVCRTPSGQPRAVRPAQARHVVVNWSRSTLPRRERFIHGRQRVTRIFLYRSADPHQTTR